MYSMESMYEATRQISFANPKETLSRLVLEETLACFNTQVSGIDQRLDSCNQRRPNLIAFDKPCIGHRLEHQV